MKWFRTSLVTAVAALGVLNAPAAWGHGAALHSVEELSEHLDAHIALLESLVTVPATPFFQIRDQLDQIQYHAGQYRGLAWKMIREKDQVLVAHALDRIAEALMKAVAQRDLVSSLELLKQIKILTEPAV